MPDQTQHEKLSGSLIQLFTVHVVAGVVKAATSEEYRNKLERRSELREELGAPKWMPKFAEPYYNISTWNGRIAFLVMELSVASPFNWHKFAGLNRLVSWAIHTEKNTRWEEHDDWV